MSEPDLKREVRNFLINKTGLDADATHDESPILGVGLVDSFGLVTLLAEIEQQYGVFPDLMSRDADEYSTLGGLRDIVLLALGQSIDDGATDPDTEAQTVPSSGEGIRVERLTSQDAGWNQLPALFRKMFDFFVQTGVHMPLAPGGEDKWLQAIEPLPEMAHFVAGASRGDELVGFATCHCKMPPAHLGGGLVGEISYVFVEPEYRRNKVAERLVGALDRWLSERKVRSVELQVLINNEAAQSFWKKLGYMDELIQMRKKIADS